MNVCELHVYSGELPCPWPSCRPREILDVMDRTFTAVHFTGPRGEELYDWVADHRTAAFSIAKLSRRAVAVLNGQPFEGGDGRLYHYSSVSGFEAIVSSGEMWISDYRALEDLTELSFGRAVAERTFGSYVESSVFRELLGNCLAASLDEAFFVASFSLESDCLNQWRAHGDGCRGVSIGFGMYEFQTLIARDPQAINLSRVTYDADTQVLLFRTVATLARQVFDLDEARDKHEPAILVRELQRILSELLPLCKSPAFTDERECRLIVVPCLTLSGTTGSIDFRHRQGVDGDVAYITTLDIARSFELPMQEVIAGPWISATDEERVRAAASAHSLNFRRSKAPLRRLPDARC